MSSTALRSHLNYRINARAESVSGDIHDRAPAILDEGAWTPWLIGETAAHEIKDAPNRS
jgi:putative SOS response-associated peptidase YedK